MHPTARATTAGEGPRKAGENRNGREEYAREERLTRRDQSGAIVVSPGGRDSLSKREREREREEERTAKREENKTEMYERL